MISTAPDTLRTALPTPNTGDDLNGAARGSSAGRDSPSIPAQGLERMRSASSRKRSLSASTVASRRNGPPDNTGTDIRERSFESASSTVDEVSSRRVCDIKDPSSNEAELRCLLPRRTTSGNRDSSSTESTVSDSVNESDLAVDGGSDGVHSSDDDSNDSDDEGNDCSGTADNDGGDRGRRYDSEYSPSETDDEEERRSNIPSDGDAQDDGHRAKKRRRVMKDQASNQTRRASFHRVNSVSCSPPAERQSGSARRCFVPSPPTSHDMSGRETDGDEDENAAPTASFSEWQLHDATLKCVTIDGVTTYQLQFKRACKTLRSNSRTQPTWRARRKPRSRTRGFDGLSGKERGGRVRFSPEEDRLIIELKEEHGLTWAEIYQRCSRTFVTRSKEALQVRYCTKLKCR